MRLSRGNVAPRNPWAWPCTSTGVLPGLFIPMVVARKSANRPIQTPRGSPLPGIATHMGVGSAPDQGGRKCRSLTQPGCFVPVQCLSRVSPVEWNKSRYLVPLTLLVAATVQSTQFARQDGEAKSRMGSDPMTRASSRRTQHQSGFRSAPVVPNRPRCDRDQGLSRSLRSVLWVRNQERSGVSNGRHGWSRCREVRPRQVEPFPRQIKSRCKMWEIHTK